MPAPVLAHHHGGPDPRQGAVYEPDVSQRLSDAGIAASMGSVGDAYDNSMIESFWGTIKSELLYRHLRPSRHDAEMVIFDWIEGWYNRHRLHSSLGYLSPEQFEQQHHNQHQEQALVTTGTN